MMLHTCDANQSDESKVKLLDVEIRYLKQQQLPKHYYELSSKGEVENLLDSGRLLAALRKTLLRLSCLKSMVATLNEVMIPLNEEGI